MKVINFFYNFIVICALFGVGIWMITSGNYVFGTAVLAACGYGVYNLVKYFKNDI